MLSQLLFCRFSVVYIAVRVVFLGWRTFVVVVVFTVVVVVIVVVVVVVVVAAAVVVVVVFVGGGGGCINMYAGVVGFLVD